MKTDELREKYLEFFVSQDHYRASSDVLVPTWDPSVLFTPAGMNQFKDHFLGKVKLDFTRATSCQKCLRTGDIENVGRTAYHHTFFEMLGNFSFGDYFKREAIRWAWEFLTGDRWLALEPARLSVTVYLDDNEAAAIWAEDVGLPSSRIQRMDEDENFWPASAPSLGPDGVCGPCSEIYYRPDDGNDVEIWNLVFTQFNRVGDPPDNLRPLPSKNIDTGMGLERTAAVLQGVETNYHIDILRPLVEAAAEVCGTKYDPRSEPGRRLRRITDHVRACTFAIHENVYPGANREKYVVRRLLRRAVLDGHQLGMRQPFLHQLVSGVAEIMKNPYPEISATVERVAGVIEKEEGNFLSTLDDGLARIERVFGEMEQSGRVMVEGQAAAELYQTFGVPPELFESMAAERNLTFDWDGFRQAMQEHGEASGKVQHDLFVRGPMETLKQALHYTEFLGYETTEAPATIKGIVAGAAPHDRLCDHVKQVGHEHPIRVVLDHTPFYGESGGQVGDTGRIVGDDFEFEVIDTQKEGELLVHYGHLKRGEMSEGAKVQAIVDTDRRLGIRRAHSATHVLHYALQKTLGSHAQQQGSKVDRDWLRFDFSNLTAVDERQLGQVEREVHRRVEEAAPIRWDVVPLAEARASGAMMLFGEKYPDPVRMVIMGEFSKELCGGTHLERTDEVGPFEIVSEEGISAGTRRIVALTGERAQAHVEETKAKLNETAEALGVSMAAVPEAVKRLSQRVRDLKKQLAGAGKPTAEETGPPAAATDEELTYAQVKHHLHEAARTLNVSPLELPARIAAMQKEIEQLTEQLAAREASGKLSAEALLQDATEVEGVRLVVSDVPGANANVMRQLIDQLRRKASPIGVLLATREGSDKVTIVAGLSDELVQRGLSAGNWVRQVAEVVGGRGGGKPALAQAGGKDAAQLPQALETAQRSFAEMIAG